MVIASFQPDTMNKTGIPLWYLISCRQSLGTKAKRFVAILSSALAVISLLRPWMSNVTRTSLKITSIWIPWRSNYDTKKNIWFCSFHFSCCKHAACPIPMTCGRLKSGISFLRLQSQTLAWQCNCPRRCALESPKLRNLGLEFYCCHWDMLGLDQGIAWKPS